MAGHITSFTYDTAGRRKTITRPNGQVITNASFDEMNRVTAAKRHPDSRRRGCDQIQLLSWIWLA